MRHVHTLLAATALLATACSGGTDTIVEADPAETTVQPVITAYQLDSAEVASAGGAAASVEADTATDTAHVIGGAITVEAEVNWDEGDHESSPGTFEVTDGADVLGCASGTVRETGGPAGIINQFTCDEGAREGTFTFVWQIDDGADGPGDANGPWAVSGATGDFAGLAGDGLWSGTAVDPIGYGSFAGEIEFAPDDGNVGDGSVESYLAGQVDDLWIPDEVGSAMVVILDADGSPVHAARTAGSDEPTVGPNDRFRVGSVTKMFTSVLTLGLVGDGLVDLDAPAGDYISRVDVPDGVTVRHLLQHRSGIPNYTNDEFFAQTTADHSRVWSPEDVLAVVADEPADFAPGDEFGYSNTNYVLLGVLIEEVTGEAYDSVLVSRLIDPFALTNTFLSDGDDPHDVATAYTGFFGGSFGPIEADYTAVATGAWAAGAMVSTPADMHTFLSALFGGELIDEELVAEMTDATDDYGLGLAIHPEYGDELYGHGGSIPGFGTMVMHSPITGRTGFWVTTSDHIALGPAIATVAPLLDADSIEGAIAAETGAEVPAWEQGRDALLPAGTLKLPELGGVEFELDQERRVVQQDPDYTILLHEGEPGGPPAEVDLIAPTATAGGDPLTTVDDLRAALTDDITADLVPIGQVDTAIGVAQGFEFTIDEGSTDFDPEQAWLQTADGGWGPYPFGQVWLIDTERGLFMVTAEAVEPGTPLDEAIATAALVLETIELVDLAPTS